VKTLFPIPLLGTSKFNVAIEISKSGDSGVHIPISIRPIIVFWTPTRCKAKVGMHINKILNLP